MGEKIIGLRQLSPFSREGEREGGRYSFVTRDTTAMEKRDATPRVEAATVDSSSSFREWLHVRCGSRAKGVVGKKGGREYSCGGSKEIPRIPRKIRRVS